MFHRFDMHGLSHFCISQNELKGSQISKAEISRVMDRQRRLIPLNQSACEVSYFQIHEMVKIEAAFDSGD